MIRYLKSEEIDKAKWDACLEESFNGLEYAKSWYLDIVADNWEGLVENDYESIFPLVTRKKWGIEYLYQPPFTQQLGLFSKKLLTEAMVMEFLRAIPVNYQFAEINLNTFNKMGEGIGRIQNWRSYELDLIKSYDNLRKGYSTNLRRNLKKAHQNRLTLVKNTRPEEIIRLFRENRGKTITHLTENDYLKLSRLVYTGIYRGVMSSYGVYKHDNELCCGAFFLRSKRKVILLFTGLTETGKQVSAMPFLIDQFIHEHNQQHLTLDFEGSNDENLARFYRSFGSIEVAYPHLQINKLPWHISAAFALAKQLKKLVRR